MARRTEEELDGREVTLVMIARNTREAGRVESILDSREVEYTITLEPFGGSFIATLFGSRILGAFFWVLSEQAEAARTILAENGVRAGLVEEDD